MELLVIQVILAIPYKTRRAALNDSEVKSKSGDQGVQAGCERLNDWTASTGKTALFQLCKGFKERN